jgi:FAD-dependent oxidoreductase domain-containing protein 1
VENIDASDILPTISVITRPLAGFASSNLRLLSYRPCQSKGTNCVGYSWTKHGLYQYEEFESGDATRRVTSTTRESDVVVLGAGIVGLASAYHILSQNPGRRVLVLEKAASAGQGDTAKTVAGIRNTFTSEVNRLLSETSIDFYKHVQEELKFDLHLELIGYLWLLTAELAKQLEAAIDRMKKDGVALKLWQPEELSKMLPQSRLVIDSGDEEAKIMGLDSLTVGLQGLKCGTLAAEKLVEFYEQEIRKLGGSMQYAERVEEFLLEPRTRLGLPGEPLVWQDAKVEGVVTNHGKIRAERTVLAAGCWSTDLLNRLGIDSHVRTKKRQVFALRGAAVNDLLFSEGFNEQGVLPLTLIPPRLIYMKPNRFERSFWVGVSDHVGRPFTFEEEPAAEEDFYTLNIYPVMSHYFPYFKDIRPYNKWAGHYDLNTIDGNPYIFEDSGLIIADGTSGSGIMKADAIGRIIAAAEAGKDIATLYGGKHFRIAKLGIETRQVEPEEFVI